MGNSIVSKLSTPPKQKTVVDPDTGKSSPSLVGEFDVMAAAAAQKQKAVDLSQQQNTATVAPVQRGSVNDSLIEDLGAAYFAENPLYSFDLKTDLSDFVYDVPKYLRRHSSDNTNSSGFDMSSYGASMLGVAAGIGDELSVLSGKSSSIGVVDNVLDTFKGLSSYADDWGRQKPLVPSFEEFRLQSLKTDIISTPSLGSLDNLSSYRLNPDLSASNVTQVANKLQPYSQWLGRFGTAASIGEIGFDMAGAYQRDENVGVQFLASTTNTAIEAGGTWGAFKGGAITGTALSGGNPLIGLASGTIAAGAFSFGYNYDFTGSSTGANSWSSQIKTDLKDIFTGINKSHDNYETYKKNNPSIWNHIVR